MSGGQWEQLAQLLCMFGVGWASGFCDGWNTWGRKKPDKG